MNEEDKEIKIINGLKKYIDNLEKNQQWLYNSEDYYKDDIEQNELILKMFHSVLNLIEKQQHIIEGKECVIETQAHNEEVLMAELEKKYKIINNSIIEIENLRQYFSEDLQPDFIRILEILKDKKVIDW